MQEFSFSFRWFHTVETFLTGPVLEVVTYYAWIDGPQLLFRAIVKRNGKTVVESNK